MKQLLETISQKWQFRYFVVGAGLILMVYAGVMPVHSTGSKDIMTPALLSQHSSSDGTSFGPVSVSGSDALSQRATDAGALRGGWSGENKNVVEQLSVAVEPVRGSRLPRDFSDSVRALRTAAEAGDPTAEFLLGHAYESGLGVTKDVTETARWYGRAVVPQPPTTPGTAAATPMNFAQAFELYRRAAEAGNGQAELYMGLEYDMGTDVPRNVEKAATWYRKAAAQGSASAENNLGVLYHEGDGLPKDGMEAVNWFSRAAARGSATAEYCLGRMYFEGDGVRQDDAQAAEWFQKAATRGSSSAQVMMSWMYATGRGVPGSTSTAYMWINLAAAKEDQARATRQQLEQIISKPELAEGQKETHDWLTRHSLASL